MATTKTTFNVLPAQESDMPAFTRIHFAAHGTGLGPLLSTPPLQDSPLGLENFIKGQQHILRSNSNLHFLKAVEATGTEPVAFAKWVIYPIERAMAEVVQDFKPLPPPPTANQPAWDDRFGYLSKMRMQYMGVKAVVCKYQFRWHSVVLNSPFSFTGPECRPEISTAWSWYQTADVGATKSR
jgi:hypothetical protein